MGPMGADVLRLPSAAGRVSLPALLRALARRGVNHLLLEAGAELNAAMLKARLVDEVVLFLAPSLLGGADSIPVIGGRGPKRVAEALRLERVTVSRAGEDIVVRGEIAW